MNYVSEVECPICHDQGYIVGPEIPYVWCPCPVGDRVRAKEPELVAKANRTREELLRQRAMSEKGYLPQRKGSAA